MKTAERFAAVASCSNDTIARVGPDAEVAQWISEDASARNPDRTIDASGCVVLPGLINCHHHLFQSLTRTIGTGQGRPLFEWLRLLYPIWAQMDPEAVYVSAPRPRSRNWF